MHTEKTPDGSDPRQVYFEHLAPEWDTKGQNPTATVSRLEELRGELGLKAGQDLLEVGCGTGQITGWLHEAVYPGRVVGIDFARGMVRQARRKHPDIDFRVADVCTDLLGEACFDVILCFHSFPHFRDQRGALVNMRRALRVPAGRLIVMHLAGSERINSLHSSFGGAVGHDHLPDAAAWPNLLESAGLEMTQCIDRDDLFCLQAVPVAIPPAGA